MNTINRFSTLRACLLITAALFLGLQFGCTSPATPQNPSASQTTPAAPLDSTNANTAYPYNYQNAAGESFTILKAPKKIISLSVAATESIYALGKQDTLLARTDFDNYPQAVTALPSIGSPMQINVEKIIALSPDLVIASGLIQPDILDQLKKANILVVTMPSSDSIDGIYKNIQSLGDILDAPQIARSINQSLQKELHDVRTSLEGKPRPSVYYVMGFGQGGDYTATPHTFVDEILTEAGGQNIASDAQQPYKYSKEKLLEKNPAYILIGQSMGMDKEGFMNTDPYHTLDAVKNQKVYAIDDDLISRDGPRFVEAIKQISAILHSPSGK